MKLTLFTTSLIFLLAFTCINAQPVPDTLWTRTYGGSNIDIAHSLQQTNDGGFIITGYTRSFGTMSGRNVWLLKTDATGNIVWNRAYDGNSDDEGHSVKQSSDGGFIIAGLTNSFGAGQKDLYLIKTDSLGNLQWSQTFGGANDDEGYSVLQTNDGGFIAAGTTSSSTFGGRDIFLVRTNASGNLVWQKNIGGLSSDGAWEISPANDGGFIIAGWTFSHGPGSLGNAWLVKIDSLGIEQWNKFFGGTSVDRAYSVKQTSDNGYILTGYTSSFGAGNDDMLLIKTDSLGNQQWMKTFGGTGRDYGYSVLQSSDGGFVAAGYTLSFGAGGDDFYVVKTDPAGNLQWFKTYGGSASDVAYEIIQTTDGGFAIIGHTLSSGAGLHDAWLIRLDTIIPVEFVSFNASVQNDFVILNWVTASEINNSGFVVQRAYRNNYFADYQYADIGFVQGEGTATQNSYYTFTDKITPGSYMYRLKQVDFDGSYYYSPEIMLDITHPSEYYLSQNFPNPFNPSTTIGIQLPKDGFVSLKVFDVLGKEIAVLVNDYKTAGVYNFSFDGTEFSAGIYFYELITDDYVSVKKMMLMK